jgi:CRP/FNR family transcriptional regulator, cyclic AMP receptor protein
VANAEHLDQLHRLRLFSSCTRKELEQIERLTDEVAVDAGRKIVKQDDVAREAFVIVEGTAAVVINGEPVAELGPGQHFGELALLDGGRRTASVEALTPMRVLVIHRPAFMGLLDEHPGIARRIMATMAKVIRDLEHPVGE